MMIYYSWLSHQNYMGSRKLGWVFLQPNMRIKLILHSLSVAIDHVGLQKDAAQPTRVQHVTMRAE
jgi:hypothetical protein